MKSAEGTRFGGRPPVPIEDPTDGGFVNCSDCRWRAAIVA
jgi:hypothetical protein